MSVWTKEKPKTDGYYWLRMNETDIFQRQPPRIIRILTVCKEKCVLEPPDFEPLMTLDEASDEFWWSSETVELPSNILSADI